MIPEGWENTDLGSLSSAPITYGVVKPGPSDDEDGVLFVRGGDFPHGKIDPASLRTITKEVSEQYRRTKLKGGEVLISLVGYPGACAIVPPELAGANIARQAAIIRPKKGVSTSFLVTYLRSPLGQAKLLSNVIGSAQQVINLKDLRNVSVPLPPEREREVIADVAETWDRAIETVEALIANARAQKQALMQQLLPQGTTLPEKRLPGFSGEWREAKLGSLADISKGEQKGRASLAEEGPVPVINGGITPSGYTDHPNTSADTITISEGGNSCGYVDLITQPFWCGGHCYALKNLKVERDYLFAVLKHRERQIMSLRVGSGLPNIQKKALSQFSIPVPPKSEQVKIGELAARADKEIAGHQSQLTALRQEKAALMQQLLTGKRRVKLPENEVA